MRFYDPLHKEKYPNGKQVMIKGMNDTKVLSDRRKRTQAIISEMLNLLQVEGYNPITEKMVPEPIETNGLSDVTTHTPFIQALQQFALTKKRWTNKVSIDAKSILKYTELATIKLNYQGVPINNITLFHITQILEQLWKSNPRFSNYRYNKYVKCYIALYKVLIPFGVVSGNVPKSIERLVETKKIRETLSDDERTTVSEYL